MALYVDAQGAYVTNRRLYVDTLSGVHRFKNTVMVTSFFYLNQHKVLYVDAQGAYVDNRRLYVDTPSGVHGCFLY